MVNRGRSGGCESCKRRRVKCDEGKPHCWRCHRAGIVCEGYKKKLTFRDQNYKFVFVGQGCDGGVRGDMVVPPLSPAFTDLAIAFYFRHYTGYGRHISYSRGFLEVLIPIYRSQEHDSALSHAIAALASLVLSIWQVGAPDSGHGQSPRESYTRAIASLRRAVADIQQVKEPSTLLAVLALQLYENVIAIYSFRPAPRTHHDGALSLLASTKSGQKSAMAGAYIRNFIRHVEISSAMRCRRPVRNTAPWSQVATVETYNPSMALDNIVAAIADLQTAHSEAAEETRPLHYDEILIVEAKRIDGQLLDWARSIPPYWKPSRLVCGEDVDESVSSYLGICDNYASCQIANIWNLWRIQRLTLVVLILNIFDTISKDDTSWFVKGGSLKGHEEIAHYRKVAQELVDSVCQSVAFYMGNRIAPSSMADFMDPDIALLGRPPLHSDFPSDKHQEFNFDMPSDEHRRHIIAQGPWHIMSPLRRLVTVLSEDDTVARLLRQGQHQWIRTQFLRVLTILHIFSPGSDESGDITADFLARQVREGAIFMSGP